MDGRQFVERSKSAVDIGREPEAWGAISPGLVPGPTSRPDGGKCGTDSGSFLQNGLAASRFCCGEQRAQLVSAPG